MNEVREVREGKQGKREVRGGQEEVEARKKNLRGGKGRGEGG